MADKKKGAYQPQTLKKNITMVELFAMASSPATLVAIATALFVAVAIARPPTLSRLHCLAVIDHGLTAGNIAR